MKVIFYFEIFEWNVVSKLVSLINQCFGKSEKEKERKRERERERESEESFKKRVSE